MTRTELKRLKAEMTALGFSPHVQAAALAIIAVLQPMPTQQRLNVIRKAQARFTLAQNRLQQSFPGKCTPLVQTLETRQVHHPAGRDPRGVDSRIESE